MERTDNGERMTRRACLKKAAAGLTILPAGLARGYAANERLDIGVIGLAGMGGADARTLNKLGENVAALCDVDSSVLEKRGAEYPKAAKYTDFRKMIAKEKLDGVVVATPDHAHAYISVWAMKHGRHVYCQKPLTQTVHEARVMASVAAEMKVITQMGTQSSADRRNLGQVELIQSGALGEITEVHVATDRPVWPQGYDRPPGEDAVPRSLDWDLWLGPAPERPFNHAYLPVVWRGWYDFGCGALGDMGCYSFDTIFRVLKLEAPTSVEASSSERYDETLPLASIVYFNFPARGDLPPVRLTWYDGGLLPARPEGWPEGRPISGEQGEGLLFIGDKGTILCRFSGGNPTLIPEAAMKAYKQPPKTLPRSPGNDREWLDACKGSKTRPGANFEFSGVVTETLLLGNVALRAGERLIWDRANLKVVNVVSSEPHISPERRSGWAL